LLLFGTLLLPGLKTKCGRWCILVWSCTMIMETKYGHMIFLGYAGPRFWSSGDSRGRTTSQWVTKYARIKACIIVKIIIMMFLFGTTALLNPTCIFKFWKKKHISTFQKSPENSCT
jgi:hypothetical protein